MNELAKQIKKKYKEFNVTPQWLGKVIRHNNRTRKRTRHQHFPKTKYKKPINKKKELYNFYKEVKKYPLSKLISIDETSIKPSMVKEYSRCFLGKRCVYKTDDNFVFKKFTLLVAISNSKCLGYKLYENGPVNKERFVDFLKEFIFSKYNNHLIILDNARVHNNNYVKDAILESGNKYQFSVQYTPDTNCIEMFFNQIKNYLKLTRRVLKFKELEKEVISAIKKVKKQNYKNYFQHSYGDKTYKPKSISRLYIKPKVYKV